MARVKVYKCCICHKVLERGKPVRLVKQLYGGIYNQYYNVEHYDFCRNCYTKFNNWINKYKEVNNE